MVSERKLSVTITGPEGMLEAMAKLLREEGYSVLDPLGKAPPPTARDRGRVEVLEILVRASIRLWDEWETTSHTWESDHDRWAAFSDRAHAWLERARIMVPDHTPTATGDVRPVFPKPGSILDTQARAHERRENERKRKARKKAARR